MKDILVINSPLDWGPWPESGLGYFGYVVKAELPKYVKLIRFTAAEKDYATTFKPAEGQSDWGYDWDAKSQTLVLKVPFSLSAAQNNKVELFVKYRVGDQYVCNNCNNNPVIVGPIASAMEKACYKLCTTEDFFSGEVTDATKKLKKEVCHYHGVDQFLPASIKDCGFTPNVVVNENWNRTELTFGECQTVTHVQSVFSGLNEYCKNDPKFKAQAKAKLKNVEMTLPPKDGDDAYSFKFNSGNGTLSVMKSIGAEANFYQNPTGEKMKSALMK